MLKLVIITFTTMLLTAPILFSQVQANAPTPLIQLETTGCLGSCPIYQLSIFEDGTVRWLGSQYVARSGSAESWLTRRQVLELKSAFTTSRFFDFKNRYEINLTDLPTTYLRFTMNGRIKTIEDYGDSAPAPVRELERLVESVTCSHRWRHSDKLVITLQSTVPQDVIDDIKNRRVVLDDVYSLIKPGFTKLMYAAGTGDLPLLRREIVSSDVNAQDESGWTALMVAAAAANPDAVSLLLKHGARADLVDKHGDFALLGAVTSASGKDTLNIVRQLIDTGAQIDRSNPRGETALMWAARFGDAELVQILLAAGANPKKHDHDGNDAEFYVRKWLSSPQDSTRYETMMTLLRKP